MCCMRRVFLVLALGTSFLLLWPEGGVTQQSPPIERLDNPSRPNDTTLQFDNRRPRSGQRGRDATVQFRPPIQTWPNHRPARRGWKLNIRGDKTDTGVVVASVDRGGAAERAGLRRGDRILTIGTERVGIVGNRTVPTRDVLRRQVDFQGDVILLVQRRNSRGLENVSVRLDAPRPR